MLFLQSTEIQLPLWMLAVGGAITILSPFIGALLTWYLSRPKVSAEVAGQITRNVEQDLKNFDFGNDVLNEAAGEIARLRKENFQLTKDNYEQKRELQTKEIQKAELRGQVGFVLQEKETILNRIKDLEAEVAAEKELCQKQMQALREAHEKQHQEVMNKLIKIEKFLHEKGIQIPAEL
jgi:chromosome segregation ATPase